MRLGASSTLAKERLPHRASACLCLKCIPSFKEKISTPSTLLIHPGIGRKSLLFLPMLLSHYWLYEVDMERASAGAAFGGWQKKTSTE